MSSENLFGNFLRAGEKPFFAIAGLILALSASACGILNTVDAAVEYEKTNAGHMTAEIMVVTPQINEVLCI